MVYCAVPRPPIVSRGRDKLRLPVAKLILSKPLKGYVPAERPGESPAALGPSVELFVTVCAFTLLTIKINNIAPMNEQRSATKEVSRTKTAMRVISFSLARITTNDSQAGARMATRGEELRNTTCGIPPAKA